MARLPVKNVDLAMQIAMAIEVDRRLPDALWLGFGEHSTCEFGRGYCRI